MEDLEFRVALRDYLKELLSECGLNSGSEIWDAHDHPRLKSDRAIRDFLNNNSDGDKPYEHIIDVLNKRMPGSGHAQLRWTKATIEAAVREKMRAEKSADAGPIPMGFKSLTDLPETGLASFLRAENLAWMPWSHFAREMKVPAAAPYGFDENRLLDALLEDPKPYVLTGKGGIGKTRFALELGRMAQQKGWVALRVTPQTTETDVKALFTSLSPARLLLIVDYVETLASGLGFDRLMMLVKHANGDGHQVRVLATCRQTYYDNLAVNGLNSAIRNGNAVSLSPPEGTPEHGWLRNWRLFIVAKILGVEIRQLDENTYDIPVIALMVRTLEGQDHGLRSRDDIRRWLYSRLIAGVVDTDTARRDMAFHRSLSDLAGFLMMFPLRIGAQSRMTDTERSILRALIKDGFALIDGTTIALAHDLVCDLLFELWREEDLTMTSGQVIDSLLPLRDRLGAASSMAESLTRNLFDQKSRSDLEKIKDMESSVDSLARTHPTEPDRAKQVLEGCLLALSLSLPEKERVFAAISTLSSYQIAELLTVWREETEKFVELCTKGHVWDLVTPLFFHRQFAAHRSLWLCALSRVAADENARDVVEQAQNLIYLGPEAAAENQRLYLDFISQYEKRRALSVDELIGMAVSDETDPAAEDFYRRAIEADPQNASNLGNFAFFMQTIRGQHDEAEALYRRAIEADPKHANNLGNFANFMTDIRGQNDEAEDLYRRAIEADPKHANTLGNFAQFLLARGTTTEGIRSLEAAERFCDGRDDLRVELAFYRYAHVKGSSLAPLRALVMAGARSAGWDLSITIARAIEDGHPEPDLLRDLASVISDGADASCLARHPAWQAL